MSASLEKMNLEQLLTSLQKYEDEGEEEETIPTPVNYGESMNVVVRSDSLKHIITSARFVFIKTMEMLKYRGGYDVEGFIQSAKTMKSDELFILGMLSPKFANPLRNIITSFFSKRQFPSFRLIMSCLVRNPEGKYTAVFFSDRKNTSMLTAKVNKVSKQVSKQIMEIIFKSILFLRKLKHIPISEILIISPTPLSQNIEKSLSLLKSYFIQSFVDDEITISPLESYYTPISTKIFSKEETTAFFEREKNVSSHTLQKISHSDPYFKYLGARSGRVVEIVRPPITLEGIKTSELTYAHLF